MDVELEKKQIVEELQHRDEEWLIIAIKKLLGLDAYDEVSDNQRVILEERVNSYKTNPNDIVTLDQLKKDLLKENRLE